MYDSRDKPLAFWSGEELEVTFTAQAVRTDYGVPGSPTWLQIEDIEIEEIEILGVRVKPETLPRELLEKIHALSDELDW